MVVQDAFLTETAQLADVVLPAALWGEKTGTFTNYDRTVHISHKAVDPPSEARPDMDIFLDFARRMDFRDKDGAPLLKWRTPEECFEAWKECSRGCPCDYSGLTYAKLSSVSGIQWPCNDQYPNGKERLYDDFHFPSGFEECGEFGHDLETGAHILEEQYKAEDPRGRVHTRTKTGRSPQLQEAAPDAFVQINADDAERLGIREGDMVDVSSRRATVRVPARIGDILPGHVFMPFHYGYWDEPGSEHYEPNGRARAANELTLTAWDAVSKQPNFKYAAVQVAKSGARPPTQKLANAAGKVVDRVEEYADLMMSKAHVERSRIADYLGILSDGHEEFMAACQYLGKQHTQEAEIREGTQVLAEFSRQALEALRPFTERYGERSEREPKALRQTLFPKPRAGSFGLLRDLHALHVLADDVHIATKVVKDAARALRDDELHNLALHLYGQNQRQQAWVDTMIKENAAQAVVVPS